MTFTGEALKSAADPKFPTLLNVRMALVIDEGESTTLLGREEVGNSNSPLDTP